MTTHEPIRTLFSRDHDTVFPKLGVFLAGPTPPSGKMRSGWRRVVTEALKADQRLHPGMIVVSPEPESGQWSDIDAVNPQTHLETVRDKQMPWELQYLNLCDITAFWLPTYWTAEASGLFAPNIGPTTRWEFGYFLQEYLRRPQQRKFIIGGPDDAESVKWAKKMTDIHGIPWHSLPADRKDELVAPSFIEAIADALASNNWSY
jgi:hypothetical protein